MKQPLKGGGCASHLRSLAGAATALLLLGSAACEGHSSRSGSPFGKAESNLRPDPQDVTLQAKRESCIRKAGAKGRLIEVASIVPVEFRRVAQPQDSGWLPTRLGDVAPMGSKLVVLDVGARTVTIFGPGLDTRITVGREGSGPGEFRDPVAVTVDTTGRILVADMGNGRVAFLDSTGTPIGSRRVDAVNVQDIATRRSDLLFAHFVIPEMMGREARFGYILTAQRESSEVTTPVVWAQPGTDDTEHLPLPGPNRFRVSTGEGLTVLFSPSSGSIDLYRGDQVVNHMQSCMPPALSDAYAEQRARYRAGRQGNSQQWFPLITDAMVHLDTVFAVGPMPDAEKRFHIDRWLVDGTPLPSLVADVQDFSYPQNIRFWGSPYDFAAFGPHGTILRLRWAPL